MVEDTFNSTSHVLYYYSIEASTITMTKVLGAYSYMNPSLGFSFGYN